MVFPNRNRQTARHYFRIGLEHNRAYTYLDSSVSSLRLQVESAVSGARLESVKVNILGSAVAPGESLTACLRFPSLQFELPSSSAFLQSDLSP